MLNVMCIRRGREYGPDYVAILHDMVRRNLPDGMAGQFMVYTDRPDDPYGPDVVVMPIGAAMPEGLILPLNCCVVGPLDKIAERGEVLDSDFVPYAEDGFPKGAKLVRFDGPKPHQCGGWVKEVWKIGGGTIAELTFDSNITQEMIVRNITLAHRRRNVRWLQERSAHNGVALIAAGGPSLKDNLLMLRGLQRRAGAMLFALNNVPAFLAEAEIYPDAHILLDGHPSVVNFVAGMRRGERYYSSQCDPAVLDAAGSELILWNPYIKCLEQVIENIRDPLIGGGTTVGTRAIGLAHTLGYRQIHLFGMDSCFQNGTSHCYEQGEYAGSLDVRFEGKSYKAPPQLLAQVEEFKNLLPELLASGCELHIHGDGLLQDVAAAMNREAA